MATNNISSAAVRTLTAEWSRIPLPVTDEISPHKGNKSFPNFAREEQTFYNAFIQCSAYGNFQVKIKQISKLQHAFIFYISHLHFWSFISSLNLGKNVLLR